MSGTVSDSRVNYLENIWAKYPEMPRGALRFGRIQQFRLGVQIVKDWSLFDAPQVKVVDVLVDGDLVAIMPGNRLLLLAPNLTKRSADDQLWPVQKKWFEYLSLIRKFFTEKRFQEVKTPLLVSCPGTEPTLEVFETIFRNGSSERRYFLPTSPELALKKLLAEGAERIFEITSVFRNGELTDRHRPEFTMLEWYRAFSGLQAIRMDMIEMIEYLCEHLKVDRPLETLTFSMPDLFKKFCNFDFSPVTTIEELKQLAERLGVDVKAAQTIDDYFYLIFLDKIENQWPKDRLVIVEKYPPYQAALARIGIDGWAERFEIYWNGLELGNAFHELNNPTLQLARSQEDLFKKKNLGKSDIELDESFFSALDYGMPPSAGIAVGLERIFMALYRLPSIDFPR